MAEKPLELVHYCLNHREKFKTETEVQDHKKSCQTMLIAVKKKDQKTFDTLIDDRPKIHTH